jgi:hypothetical protein
VIDRDRAACIGSRAPGEQWRRLLPLVMLTVVVLIWSSNNIASKLVLRETSPGLLTLVRFTLTTVLFHLPAFLLIRPIPPLAWFPLWKPTACDSTGKRLAPESVYRGALAIRQPTETVGEQPASHRDDPAVPR